MILAPLDFNPFANTNLTGILIHEPLQRRFFAVVVMAAQGVALRLQR